MSINKISGNILQDNLQRGSNLSIQSNLTYFDVTNQRVGIGTTAPQDKFDVVGVANASNVRITSAEPNGVFYASATKLVTNSTALTWDGANFSVTGNVICSTISANGVGLGNLSVSNTTISAALAIGNITLTPTGNAAVIIDCTSGIVVPVGNTAQRLSPATAGALRYNSQTSKLEFYDGAEWDSIVVDVTAQTLNGDGSTTVFNLDRTSATASTLIMLNGIVQLPTTAYSVSGNVLTFVQAPAVSDVIDIRFL